MTSEQRGDAPKQPRQWTLRRGISGSQILGLLLTAGGAAWLLNETHLVSLQPDLVISSLLIILGISLFFVGGRGYRGLIWLGLFLTFILVTGSPIASFDVASLSRSGIGDHSEAPTSADAGKLAYSGGLGDLDIDLTRLTLDRDTEVVARVGLGDIKVLVPNGQPVQIDSNVGLGDVRVFGQHIASAGSTTFSKGDDPTKHLLKLTLTAGLGDVSVRHP